METKSSKVFIVIPVYNEAQRIEKVVRTIKKYHPNILIVDDGSKDDTYEVIKKLGVVVLKHRLNLGKGAAMKTGAEGSFKLGADSIIFIDGDGQHDAKHIPQFISEINKGYDIVFGSRNLSYGVPLVRYLGNKLGAILINLVFNIYRSDLLCGYIGMTQKAYERIKWDSARYGVETEIVARTGKNKLRYSEISMEAIYLDKFKGVTIFDAIGILSNIPRWKLFN